MKLNAAPKLYPAKVFDQVFITNSDDVRRWASKDTFFFRVFKFLYQYGILRVIFDGYGGVNPMWQAVLLVDDVIDKKREICIEDTLVLHCDSPDAYDKIIPYIYGPYTRLVLHGCITVDQVKQLVNKNVQNVRISAKIEMTERDYDGFAKFMVTQPYGLNPCFTICRNEDLALEFVKKLEKCSGKNRSIPRIEVDEKTICLTTSNITPIVYSIYFSFLIVVISSVSTNESIFAKLFLILFLVPMLVFLFIMMFFQNYVPQTDTIDPFLVPTNDLNSLVYASIRFVWAQMDITLLKMCDYVSEIQK
uniref:Short transient receptor potential channel 5 n=1 Tax=Panagrellus redivivus TaxID=6233 RepID=A0A7E4W7F0_PANRE